MADATNMIAEGEVLQLMNAHDPDTTEERYLQVIYRKTAKLFEAGMRLARSSRGPPRRSSPRWSTSGATSVRLSTGGRRVDYRAQPEELGKNLTTAEGKPTLPLIYALSHSSLEDTARLRRAIEVGGIEDLAGVTRAIESSGGLEYTARLARREKDLALEALGRLPDSAYLKGLHALAEFAVARTY
jgi:octaprenyl-diphosphate synthase